MNLQGVALTLALAVVMLLSAGCSVSMTLAGVANQRCEYTSVNGKTSVVTCTELR